MVYACYEASIVLNNSTTTTRRTDTTLLRYLITSLARSSARLPPLYNQKEKCKSVHAHPPTPRPLMHLNHNHPKRQGGDVPHPH
jgi:hypothetical protein